MLKKQNKKKNQQRRTEQTDRKVVNTTPDGNGAMRYWRLSWASALGGRRALHSGGVTSERRRAETLGSVGGATPVFSRVGDTCRSIVGFSGLPVRQLVSFDKRRGSMRRRLMAAPDCAGAD